MGVPFCITEELLLHDDIEATRMTKWNNNTKLANHTDMVKVIFEGTICHIYHRVRGLQNEALCELASTVLQLPESRPPWDDLQVGSSDLQILCRKTSLPPMPEGGGVVINYDPYQDHSPSTSERSTTTNGTHREVDHINLVHWTAQEAITKTSAIKTAIVMIQDTIYKRRLDDLPNLRIHGYHTYHRTMDEEGHGMVTMIKHTIPSEEAEQIQLGDGTETLSTRIWFKNKPLLQHNIYRVDGELDITTPLTREPRSIFLGDFNARDVMSCRDHSRAGRTLN